MAGHLAGCQEPPQPFDLYKAGQRAISRASHRELREHGITRSSGGPQAMPGFDACYDQLTAARQGAARLVATSADETDTAASCTREAPAFGKALHDIRTELGLSVAEPAARAAMSEDDIERIEEGGTEPTVSPLRHIAAALTATVHSPRATTWARSRSRPPPPDITCRPDQATVPADPEPPNCPWRRCGVGRSV